MSLRTWNNAGTRARVRRAAVWFAAAVALLTPAAVTAQTWTNPAGGNWSVPGNWTPGVPTSGTTTALTFGSAATQAATYTANNDLPPFTLNSVTINNTAGTVTI